MRLLEFLAMGGAAGWLAGRLMRGRHFGVLADVLIGSVGSFVGGFLFSLLEITAYGTIGSFVTALVGSMTFVYALRALRITHV